MKKNLILLVICAVIAAVFFFDKKREEEKKELEEKESEMVTLQKDQIGEITIEKDNQVITAVKRENDWDLTSPFAAAGERSAWDNIASTYSGGKRQRVIAENPDNLAAFGLAEPKASITVKGATQDISSTILLGDETPVSGSYYAMVKGVSDVVTVMSSMYTVVDKRIEELRDKSLVRNLETTDVQKIEIAAGEQTLSLTRRNEDEWIINEPVNARADRSKVSDMINAVRNGKIQKFIEETPDVYEAYGLAEPATRIVFHSGTADDQSNWVAKSLLLGATTPEETYFAKQGENKNVFTIQQTDLNKVISNVNDLRVKKLTGLSSWEVEQFKILASGAVILEASKDGGDWYLLQPVAQKAEYTGISDLLRDAVGLEVSGFLSGTKDEYGIGSNDVSIELNAGEKSQTITLSGPKETGEGRVYYGAKEDPLELYAIPEEKILALIDAAKTAIPPASDAMETGEPTSGTNGELTLPVNPVTGE